MLKYGLDGNWKNTQMKRQNDVLCRHVASRRQDSPARVVAFPDDRGKTRTKKRLLHLFYDTSK
jgi:hypothetical protein